MNILDLAMQLNLSKKLTRSGWKREKVTDAESISDHGFGIVTLITLFSPSLKADTLKMVKMAIIHNFASTVSEDIVAERSFQIMTEIDAIKKKIERQAIEKWLTQYGDDYLKIYDEMVENKTNEAVIFTQLDKLEMAIQAYQYEKEQGKKLNEFFKNAGTRIKHPVLKKVFEDLLKMRE